LTGPSPKSPFKNLPNEIKTRVSQGLLITVTSLESASKDSVPLNDSNHSLVWWSIRRLGLRPLSDVFAKLEKDDVIEIYNSDFIQVFRSLNMFRFLSYSLEEILCYQWFELFKREQNITESLLSIASNMGAGKITSTVEPDLPAHTVEEIFSASKNWAKMKFRLITPLFGPHGQPAGLMTASKVVESGSLAN